MPSNLPVIKVRVPEEKVHKIKAIAKHNQKSVSKEIEMLIDKHIAEFEEKNGLIDIVMMNTQDILEDISDRINKRPPYGDN